jgi:regulator of nonsense transcripts 2
MFFNKGAAGKKLDYFLSFFQYYIHTKNPLPMDIEFLVQDIFALTRPQWKLASNVEEATKVFQLAIVQDQKTSGLDKVLEQEDGTSGASTDDEDGAAEQDEDEESGSEEGEAEADVCHTQSSSTCKSGGRLTVFLLLQDADQNPSYRDDESEDEAIVVTREEEEVDPEDEADFDREYAKMMAESLETRKFQPKQQFDIPLPVRPKNRDVPSGSEPPAESGPGTSGGTMAFALLTKRGNRQQVGAESWA